MTLESLAVSVLWPRRTWPEEDERIAAWIVWTMRGTWRQQVFFPTYLRACICCGRDLSGHA